MSLHISVKHEQQFLSLCYPKFKDLGYPDLPDTFLFSRNEINYD